MTTLLETFVERMPVDGKNEHRVYFRVTSSSGSESSVRALDVDVTTARDQPYKLAELVAIKYILMHSPYVGENRSGDGLKINVSSGAIKKVQKLHTTNSDMVIHGRFLQVRFSGAIINTARRFDWVKDFTSDVIDISLSDCVDKPVTTRVGDLHLTRHAVERFKERLDIPSVDRAWKRLTKLMTSGDWNVVKPVTKLSDKYKNRTTETWAVSKGHASPVNVVIVRNQRVNRVVTVIAA